MEETFTKAINILNLAKQHDVDIILNGDQLQLKIPKGRTVDKKLLEELGANKQLIIDYLGNANLRLTVISNGNHKIDNFNRDTTKHIPLSFSQERLWFIDRLEGSLKYHLPIVLRLTGTLNSEALSKALTEIVNRHEILRTVYDEENGEVYQRVKEAGNWILKESDGRKYLDDQNGLESYIKGLTEQPFDFGKDDMLRAELITMDAKDHLLVVTMHHIASDATSMPVLVREVSILYSTYASGKITSLSVPELQYADYAVWQREHIRGDFLEEKLRYWKEKLEDVAPLQLPTDNERSADGGARGSKVAFEIDAAVSRRVLALAQSQGATLYMTLLAAFKVLLYRYSGQEDICVGTSIAGRPQRELEGLIGFFANTLALRDQVRSEMSFIELLQEVKITTLGAYSHQQVPFEKVVEMVVKERVAGYSPLFQVMLVLINTPGVPELKLGELRLKVESQEQTTSKFDLTFFIRETKAGFRGEVQYNTGLYNEARIQKMAGHFKELLQSITAAPQTEVGKLEMLTQAEKDELQTFEQSQNDYPKDKTIAELFEEQAINHPNEIAIAFEETKISYKALNERSNQLAHYLQSKGVKENTLVPLLMERGAEMLVGILGILKAGGAYVPVDTDFPSDRITYMLEDTKATVVVTTSTVSHKLPQNSGITILELDEERAALRQQPTTTPETTNNPQSTAYVIYTSGSTGKPKGVLISHNNIADYTYGLEARIKISRNKSFALVSSIATDLGNTVLYGSLLTGGTLHVFTKETVSHIEALHAYFSKNEIDCLKIVPSHWKALTLDNQPLLPKKQLIFGGEALQRTVVETIKNTKTNCQIINHYGPTETTIGKLLHEVDKSNDYGATIPIGKPFSNTSTYILTKELTSSPIGVPGQLYIAGDGLAQGYLNNPELTKEKFITHPVTRERIYATGDKVQYDQQGNITFIGRVDDQVKIRGYRVEPGEIGRILEQSEYINQAIVLARDDKQGNKQLIGYIVAKADYDKNAIQEYLKEQLPDYMIPNHIVELTAFPLTANGKIDRRALPDPEAQPAGQYTAPRNETEAKLKQIWQEVLELEDISITADFFELGGHSLLAVRLISMIRKSFGMELPIADVFDYPTVQKLAARLTDEASTDILPPVTVEKPRPEYIPLSFSQERLWFIDQLEGSVQYHIPAVLRLKGQLNSEALAYTLRKVIDRHEVLRTTIGEHEGKGYQNIRTADRWTLGVSEKAKDEADLSKYIVALINKPFDLSADYMLRADLIRLEEQDHFLVVTMHHIVSDGWSRSILIKEVVEIYEACTTGKEARLSLVPVQYADYAIWQQRYMQGELLETKLSYWKAKLDDVTPLQLPTDYNRPAIQSSRGAIYRFNIDQELSGQLQALGQANGATLYMTLLTVFKILLYRYSGQEDICVGTPVAGRNQQELEGLIGFFINMLALRSRVSSDMPFIQLLDEIKRTTLEAYRHQEVPFEKVVDAVVKSRDMSRSPLFQVMFSLQNTPDAPALKLGELRLSAAGQEHATAKFDIAFIMNETSSGIHGAVEYNTDLYKEETIAAMTIHYLALLTAIAQSATTPVGRLKMLSQSEETALLSSFNATSADYGKDKSLVALFEAQAAKTPDKTAVIFENESLTYAELDEKSNQLARYLQKQGIKAETLVPICIERSLEMIVGILGILKAGGAYVPVDPEYPQDRIRYMLEDTGAKLALSNAASKSKLRESKIKVITLDGDWEQISKEPSTATPAAKPEPGNLAYMIYTSGSTGRPKGAMNEHGGIVNRLQWTQDYFKLTGKDAILQKTTFSFDVSVWELFWPIITGARLVFAKPGGQADSGYLKAIIKKENITLLHFVPSMLTAFLSDVEPGDCKSVENVLCSGEALTAAQVQLFEEKLPHVQLHNLYGPTEAAIDVSCWSNTGKEEKTKSIPIGKPVANTRLYILNQDGQLSPVGVPGELYIGGIQVGRGYLNKPELTAEKFINDPFSNDKKARLYKTGDLARWQADGNIDYLGRIDDQVKIRGYRIELGEIESVLLENEAISQGVVLAKEDGSGNKRLVGYVVAKAFDKQAIQAYLNSKLPEYMVPALWVELETIPLTANGKVDRKSLPDPELPDMTSEYVAPRNETERVLAEIWQERLGLERIGIYDNFFELGGHSLLAMRIISVTRLKLQVEVTIKDMFINPTICALAGHLQKQKRHRSQSLIPIKASGNKKPLYIICGAGGTVFKFRDFVNMLDRDQPVYGLQQAVLNNDPNDFPDTIERIAARYIEEILLEDPEGPYALSGHCLGGIIAFEMARQFEAIGKKVSLLAMFDTNVKEQKKIAPASVKNFRRLPAIGKRLISKTLTKIKFELFLLTKHPKQALHYKIRKIKPWFFRGEPKPENIDQDVFNKLTKKFEKALDSYRLEPFDIDVLLFNAMQHFYFVDAVNKVVYKELNVNYTRKYAWKKYTRSVTGYEVKGEHSTMFESENAREFSTILQRYLNEGFTSKQD